MSIKKNLFCRKSREFILLWRHIAMSLITRNNRCQITQRSCLELVTYIQMILLLISKAFLLILLSGYWIRIVERWGNAILIQKRSPIYDERFQQFKKSISKYYLLWKARLDLRLITCMQILTAIVALSNYGWRTLLRGKYFWWPAKILIQFHRIHRF